MRVAIAGGDPERLAKTAQAPTWIEVDAKFVYFSTLSGEVYRVAKTGGEPARISPAMGAGRSAMGALGSPRPFEFMLAGDLVYFASGKGIFACPTAGCSVGRWQHHEAREADRSRAASDQVSKMGADPPRRREFVWLPELGEFAARS